MITRVRLVRALAALTLGATGGLVVSSGAAFAAACPAGTGVTVVVNSSVQCDANGGGSAASNFGDTGHSLTDARRQPGFVCRVDGAPASDPCVNASPPDAYWGLFWANGTGGGWNFASQGAYSLTVPKGGWVAFAFQNSNSRTSPGVTPYTAPPAPKPTPKPKPTTSKPKATTSAGGTSTSAPSAKPGATTTPKGKASSSATPSATPGAAATPSAAAAAREEALQRTSQETDTSTSTLWVGSLLALALLVGMGFTVWQRRARRS